MRISSSSIYDLNIASMNQQQSDLLNTQLHISSGKRVMTPADDPVAAAQAVSVNQAIATNTQYATNQTAANSALGLSDNALQNVTTLLQSVQSTAVNAGNGSLTNTDRHTLAATLQQNLQQLLGLANSTDGSGNYIFSGSQGTVQPFTDTPSGVTYNGNDVVNYTQVATGRKIATSNSGADIFMRVKNGNGSFATSSSTTNSGTGVISQGSLVNPVPTSLQAGNTYTVTFTVTGTTTTYSITGTDSTGAALPTAAQPGTLPTNVAYTSGQSISFNGIQFNVQGAPASGDTFTVQPSTNVSVFQTMTNLINSLNTSIAQGDSAAQAQLNQQVGAAIGGLNQALSSVLTVRASVGSRMSEVSTLQSSGRTLKTVYQQQLSNLQDLDYNKAISTLTQQQTSLQAAMQSFQKISGLSLFNYM